ncbi:SCL-interrupting locus protein homolog [Ciona intestinalis]
MLSVSSYFTPESGKVIRGQNVKKVDSCFVFPQSPKHLWDMTPQGESFMFGFQHYPTVDLVCVERCIRLAHKHAIQDVEERGNETFRGFLIGSLEVVEDESGIMVTLDRFDPGIVKDDVIKSPSAILPNDIIVPVEFTLGKPDDADVVYSCTTGDFQASIQNLHKNFSSTNLDVSKVFPLRIHCYHTMNNDETMAGLLIRATSVVVSTTVHLTPVTPIPVIPTALAKNLCSSLNVSYVQRIQKSGFMTMDQTRKILLLLDSDPKASRLPTVGVWVSGVMTPYHPYVLMACVRYLQYSGLKERILSEGCYLLALYTVASTKPTFYACKLDQNEKLDFDVLSAQDYIHMYKPNDSSSTFDFKFTLEPPDGSRDRAMFTEALQKSGTFPFPAYQKQLNPLPTISDVTNKPLKQRNHSKEKTNNDENCPPREFPQITPVEFPSPAPTPTPKYKLDDLEPSILEPSLIYQESFQPPNPHYKTQPRPRNPTILKGNNLNHPHHRSHSHPDPIPTFTHKRTPTPKQTQPPHPYFTPNHPHFRTLPNQTQNPTPKTPNDPSKRPHTPNQPHTPPIHPLAKTQTPNSHHLTPQNHLPPNPLHRPPESPQTPAHPTLKPLQPQPTPTNP